MLNHTPKIFCMTWKEQTWQKIWTLSIIMMAKHLRRRKQHKKLLFSYAVYYRAARFCSGSLQTTCKLLQVHWTMMPPVCNQLTLVKDKNITGLIGRFPPMPCFVCFLQAWKNTPRFWHPVVLGHNCHKLEAMI